MPIANGKDSNSLPNDKPVSDDHRTAFGSYRAYLWKYVSWALKYLIIMAVPGLLLAIPIFVTMNNKDLDDDAIDAADQRQTRQLVFWLFLWLEVSWLGGCVAYGIGCALPYIFRFVARYVNPAHARYWRIIRVMRKPITVIGFVVASYATFEKFIVFNDDLAVAYNLSDGQLLWASLFDDFLQQGLLWAGFYVVEKIIILYITIHYHFRSDLKRISHSKDTQNALMALYEASTYLYPVGTPEFADEDVMIGNATGAEHGEYRVRVTRYLARLGIDSYAMTSFFGNFLSSDGKSHWLRPASSYAIVERAVANPKSAAALARRIWMSMVPLGKDVLTAQDIAEVLGPFRKDDAAAYFKALDQGDMGDIRLDEMEWAVVEAGKVRNAIYRSMHASEHNINTFDWIGCGFLATIMTIFILVFWVPTIKDIQATIQFFVVGLSFAVGRTVHHFLSGCVFILFDHPYDIGDRVELWSNQNPQSVSLFVERTSLLYTVFRRVDNWTEMQVANEFLQQCRIENVTRSGSNRQHVSMMIDIRTSFRDLTFLRAELEAFLKHPDNKRDYLPNLAMAIVNVHELNKLELKVVFTHRTNFANEPLRAARSMKFMCALVAALRKVPIARPDGGPLGQEGRPLFNVMMSEQEANDRLAGLAADKAAARIDAENPPPSDAARAAEEQKAMAALGKMPPVARKGPPLRSAPNAAVSTGVDAGNSTGLRTLPHFRG
ncbi:hypothetical protein B0T26DRAFT_653339 [Lasiosphaeria miniovina]|uniref:Mechanosensitive ion channel protein n=1 Tax=Lasiosphaeria miniovina TaxID=1954250 RepID=A0AA40DQS5_9PEZI|nr:uncharacterized protein B0T26DRAFT_653339 [Lasiosphaeria miniovina]KAK0710046.1 hypothetical protein B0T26DRAFT_653339 [Lasiosphaeria miniovina]